ncbi:LytTR family DNA-binding domain-containing protein [Aquimarina sp. RZ0]|uniref:LytR/AlgR family response regulator transcription factor n=1 Tax=Aquimarina sp. RZ0 TaxID=2607730 RepID=UPI00165EFA2E|nr:response regulator transcription factor [Aquimarina sp. RZ0]
MNIYIVEDDLFHLEDIKITLEELGYDMLNSSDDPFEAQEEIETIRPDIVLMDIHLQGRQSGIALAKKIKSLYGIPILFTSSNTDTGIMSEAVDINPIGYLTKPINKNDLKAAMILAQNNIREEEKEELSDIFVKSGNKLVKVVINTILFAHTDSKNYCSIVTSDNKKLSVRYSILGLHKLLGSSIFIQTHRSYIVNWQKIDFFHESDQVIEVQGHHIPLGRTFKEEVYNRLKVI